MSSRIARGRVRFTLRSLAKRPLQSLLVVTMLAIGFAAAASVLTFLRGAVLSPFPYPESDRIFYAYTTEGRASGGATDRWRWSGPDFLDLRERVASFEAIGAFGGGSFNWTGDGFAERVRGLAVTPGYFDVFAMEPVLGRVFDESDMRGRADLAVISRAFWENRLDADPAVLGTTLHLNGRPKTVIGVMPARFRHIGSNVWTLARADFSAMERGDHPLFVMARLEPGVTATRAEAELEAVRSGLADTFGNRYPVYRDAEFRLNPIDDVVERAGPAIYALTAGVVLLLLLTWLNIGHLLLARGMDQRRDVAVRMACGAKRGDIVADRLVESLLLFLPAAIAGFAGAALALDWLVGLVPARPEGLEYIAPEAELAVDPVIFIVILAGSLAGAVVAGLFPALKSSNVRLSASLKQGARDAPGGSRWFSLGRLMTAGQFALTAVLLSGAVLLAQTLGSLRNVDLGFRAAGVTTFQLSLPGANYESQAAQAGFYRELVSALQARPEIASAGASHLVPLQGFEMRQPVSIEGRADLNDGRPIPMVYDQVTPGYLETLEIGVLRGRGITPADDRGAAPVVLVNRAFVERHFPDADPLGRFLTVGDEGPPRRIVGVVADARQYDIERAAEPAVYVPHAQAADPRGWMVVAMTPASPGVELAPAAREVLHSLDATLPAFAFDNLESIVSASLGVRHMAGVLSTGFAATALLVAALGIFGVMSQSVARRRRELGIRGALGATRASLRRMVLFQALTVAATGSAAGLALAAFVHRWMDSLLYGLEPTDLVAYGFAAAVLLCTGAAASALPAWRASRIAPANALRDE